MKLLSENDQFLSLSVDDIDLENLPENFQPTVSKMIDLMYEKRAIGLAANQVGLSWRVFVIRTEDGHRVCINPKVLKVGDVKPTKEGCLSFPGLALIIHRPNFISVEYYNENLEKITGHLDGIEAVCFQHELAHLNGRLFTEEVSKFQLKRAYEKRKKMKTVD